SRTTPRRRSRPRQFERLAFEIVSTESLPHADRKAAALTERGVVRVFAVDVRRRRALEWARRTGTWEIPSDGGAIAERGLALPLPRAGDGAAAEAQRGVVHQQRREHFVDVRPGLRPAGREPRQRAGDEARGEHCW